MPILTPEERVGSTMAGKYRLDRIVATGGMATVFAGMHEWTERTVAVKILNYEHARDPEVVRRFLQEARAAAQLKHPNVVDVLDMGEDVDGTVYLVLELLQGETLKARMRRGRLGAAEIEALILPVMRAVSTAHLKSVVHRDLKPDNVFLAIDEAGRTVPKLLDFGIAKVSHGDSSSTRTGMMVGTPQYMSPEQVRGERDVGAAADVWSMGVVLHAALSGRLPFEGDSTAVVLARVITERARPLHSVAPSVPPALAGVVDRALQYEASARFVDMAEMIRALEAAVEGRASPSPSVRPPEPTRVAVPAVAEPHRSPPASEPPVTPFAWAGDPEAPPPSRSRTWLAVGVIVGIGLVTLAAVAFSSEHGTHTAGPTITSTPLPPQAPIASTLTTPAEPVALAPPLAEREAPSPSLIQPAVVAEPDAGLGDVTADPVDDAADDGAPRERTTREPRRGTRGALILH